jgi:hypothetical protein
VDSYAAAIALVGFRLILEIVDGRKLIAARRARAALHRARNAKARALTRAAQSIALAECVHETQPFPFNDNRLGE